MNLNQISWFISFFIFFFISIFVTANQKRREKIFEIFNSKITWLFMIAVIGFIITAFFSKDNTYKKACILAFIALLIAFFSELHMIFAPFFLTLCMVMSFPELF
jgi:hypothetical protein|tara:strand:+ start:786 stop:1097 length:312 start_codon:yes stop_codon:yes gene_type:complete